MNKIKVTFYMTGEQYALLAALRLKCTRDGRMATQTEVINEALKTMAHEFERMKFIKASI